MRMENVKVVGPNDIPVDVWQYLGEREVEFLIKLFMILDNEKMSEEWRKKVLVPILKNKGGCAEL